MSQLTITDLTKSFNDDNVVDSVSFSVEKGEIMLTVLTNWSKFSFINSL